jgi:hypothetical protein
MNSFTNSILTLLLGWLRTLLNAARDFISSDSSTALFEFFHNNWRILFLILCLGGFALDKIVYLIRWRPQPIWLRWRKRRGPTEQKQPYDMPVYADDAPTIPDSPYEPDASYPYTDAAPTVQYQLPQQQAGQHGLNAQPPTMLYSTPRFAPEASQNDNPETGLPLHWDESSQGHTFAPAGERQQRFAFGMAPSFGSAQSEPAYQYPGDVTPAYIPPQYSTNYPPVDTFAPPSYIGTAPDEVAPIPPPEYQEPNPYFRPFSDRDSQPYPPHRMRGFGAVAKKARNLLNADEAAQSLSYQDLHPTVDVTKAFHSPVYPEKKSEGDA